MDYQEHHVIFHYCNVASPLAHPHTLMGGSCVKWMEEEQGEIWLMDELAQYVSAAKLDCCCSLVLAGRKIAVREMLPAN